MHGGSEEWDPKVDGGAALGPGEGGHDGEGQGGEDDPNSRFIGLAVGEQQVAHGTEPDICLASTKNVTAIAPSALRSRSSS